MGKLVCSNITKKYGNRTVLDNINLEIEQGKIYGLIGRNGAGKTTLMSVMTAQNPADGGVVTYDGEPVWENQKVLDHICFSREINTTNIMGQNNYKVKDYLKVASIYYPNWDKDMADRLVEKFEIDVKKKITKLSKGMLSMVTIIIALASKADITILDEPVAGLDVVAREYFYRLIIDEQLNTGRTFIVSTHIIEEAAGVFEEVIMLDKGRILLKENEQELLSHCVHISGREQDVDAATDGLKLYKVENIGRKKSATLLLNEGDEIKQGYDVTVQPISLQNLFVALCGEQ